MLDRCSKLTPLSRHLMLKVYCEIGKIWMFECLCSSQSLIRVNFQTILDKLYSIFGSLMLKLWLNRVKLSNLRKFNSNKPLICIDFDVLFYCKLPKGFLDEMQLVNFILSWKKWLSRDHFIDNTPDWPHIQRFSISLSNEQLRTPIPSGCHVICEIIVVVRYDSGKSKIA